MDLQTGPSTNGRGHSALVVEDDGESRESLAALLQVWGYAVDSVSDGREALRRAYLHLPSVAIIDLGLPDISGYDLAHELRALSLRSCPRLVALTGQKEKSIRRAALMSGFDAYLTKPANLANLRQALRSV